MLELDGDYKPVALQYYEKDGSDVGLLPGAGTLGAGPLGYFVSSIGGFDYRFSSKASDKHV
ncbi:MAG: hypothetical protein IPK76_05435 [Lewinellaceae bacterium]|nr:hypothetical protein [Lewinellaceae bacterium]